MGANRCPLRGHLRLHSSDRQQYTVTTTSVIPLAKRILVSFGVAWLCATSLGLIHAVQVMGSRSVRELWVMGVIQIAGLFSAAAAILLTPLVAWAVRNYRSMKWVFCLWVLLLIWLLVVQRVTQNDSVSIFGALVLCVGGLIGIRLAAHP